jgi:major vault protein
MSNEQMQKRDLVLPPGTYAYMADVTKGVIKIYTGPTVINPTAQERPVLYDTPTGTYKNAASLEEAMRISPVAPEGHYIILRNPAKLNKHPDEGSAQPSADQEIGRAIIVPGPATFALWPGQVAEVLEGHHLRSNQYLLIRVYNEDEARKNWTKAVVKAVEGDQPSTQSTPPVTLAPPPDLTIGKQLIIRGTEVSFYIPPTGIEVVADPSDRTADRYVRDALTLERLEYAILVDENGKKRYETGPQVVFPLPSERFIEVKDDGVLSKKFRAIELNTIQGIHVKVIADYTEGGRTYRAGEELFITGKDTQIYFPREEHSAIKYDGKAKHFATAVPAGEARYVMNRMTGEIRTVRGPAMLLPDPRNEVIVRRVLSDRQCQLWYPGNTEALVYNQGLRNILQNVPTTRQGAISEGDVARGAKGAAAKQLLGTASIMYTASNAVMESSRVSGEQSLVGDEISRSSTYTQPRTLTLETKYQGAPQIDVWTGYAVMVVSKTGNRRVVRGPTTVLLEYDETLEVLELSKGKPKTTDDLLRTSFLRTENNKVSDIVNIETSDHVQVQVYLSYLVDFVNPHALNTTEWQTSAAKWFSVENYVKFLCDHVRSVLKGRARKLRVEDFYANSTDYIRDFILGKSEGGKRTGMAFEQNGMFVSDVEVLKVHLQDEKIRPLLDAAQHEVVKTNIELSTLNRNLEIVKQKETISREEATVKAATKQISDKLQIELAASELAVALARFGNTMRALDEERKTKESAAKTEDMLFDTKLARVKRERDQETSFAELAQQRQITLLKAEAESIVQRFAAVSGNFSEALLALSRNETLVKVAQAWDVQKTIAGETLAGTLKKVFDGTPLGGIVEKLTVSNGTGSKPVTVTVPAS